MDEAAVTALVRGFRREALHRRLFVIAGRLASFGFAALYLYILIVLGHSDVFYVTLSLASIVTGLSGFIAAFYYEVPGVVRALHDPTRADAAWTAIDRLRPDLLPRLLEDIGVPPDERPALVQTIDRDALVRLTAARAADRWRTIGPLYLAGYLVVLAGYLVLLARFEPEVIR